MNKRIRNTLFLLTLIGTALARTQEFPGQEYQEIQPFFKELYSENEDIVGWLNTGTGIDLPVMQLDNDFYLHHDFHKNEKYAGTLFVNQINYLWPRDKVLFIHGHNMRDGSMFGSLMLYENPEYVSNNSLIMFRTLYDQEEVWYTPVYAFNASMNEDNPDYFNLCWIYLGNAESPFEPEPDEMEPGQESGSKQIDASQDETDTAQSAAGPDEADTAQSAASQDETDIAKPCPGMQDSEIESEEYKIITEADIAVDPVRYQIYLDAMKKISIWHTSMDVTTEDELICLITCSYYQENGRFILVCRKLREEETPSMAVEHFVCK